MALLAKWFLVLSLPVFEVGHSSRSISEAEAQVSERDICPLGKDQGTVPPFTAGRAAG